MMTGSVVATNDQRLQTIQVPHHQRLSDVMDNNTRDPADASAKDDDNRSHNNNDNSLSPPSLREPRQTFPN